MRHFSTIIIILLLFTFLPAFAAESKLDSLLVIGESDLALIEKDYDEAGYLELFKSFVHVSEESESMESSLEWFRVLEKRVDETMKEEFGSTRLVNFTPEEQADFAERLLTVIHDGGFRKYVANANRLSEVIRRGEYNCVSSSILYAVFLRKYGIAFRGVETHDHVFIETDFGTKQVDVETTNRFGFNPGQKRDVLDDFGKVTGFTYVPAKDYKNRNNIDYKKLLMLVYHNLATFHFQAGRYERSLYLGYVIKKGRADEKGDEDFSAHFKNYLVKLNRKGKSREAIELIGDYFERFGQDEYLSFLRFGFLNDFVVKWKSYSQIDSHREFLLAENARFDSLKGHTKFNEVYFYFTYKVINYYIRGKEYKLAIDETAAFKESYSHKDLVKSFENILIGAMKEYDYNKKSFHLTAELLDYAAQKVPDYYETIESYKRNNITNLISHEINSKNLSRAMELTRSNLLEYKDDRKLKALLKNIYVSYSLHHYKEGDLEKTIHFSEEGLKEFPGDRTLTNNYRTFFQNFLNEELKAKNYSKARKIVNLALDRFPNNSHFIKVDRYLLERNY